MKSKSLELAEQMCELADKVINLLEVCPVGNALFAELLECADMTHRAMSMSRALSSENAELKRHLELLQKVCQNS